MSDFYIDLGVSIVITLLRSIKGPDKKKKFKAMFLKVHNLIQQVYAGDEDFRCQ